MVYVRLEGDWTDPQGNLHRAGETVDVDAATLAQLQASGLVSEPGSGAGTSGWVGPTGDRPAGWVGPTGDRPAGWVGPTGDRPDGWVGPTGDRPDGWVGPTGGGTDS
jgi:hypothetical protein